MTSWRLNNNFETYATKEDVVFVDIKNKLLTNLQGVVINTFQISVEDNLPVSVLAHDLKDFTRERRFISFSLEGYAVALKSHSWSENDTEKKIKEELNSILFKNHNREEILKALYNKLK